MFPSCSDMVCTITTKLLVANVLVRGMASFFYICMIKDPCFSCQDYPLYLAPLSSYTCAQPFSTTTCISLIKHIPPAASLSLLSFIHFSTLLRTIHVLSHGEVVHLRSRFSHNAINIRLEDCSNGCGCTALYASAL
jgi:hypothetical protein